MDKQNNLNLLSVTSRVEAPFIKVTIGNYVFGVFQKVGNVIRDNKVLSEVTYPNYIKGLDIEKINGVVNKYTLHIDYAITENDDPNFFEKVFSSIAKSRKIVFEYGDMSTPSFCYKKEEALFLRADSSVNASSAVTSYKVYAVSNANAVSVGKYNFPARKAKPSTVIRDLLYRPDRNYGLLEVFPGMSNETLVYVRNLIFSNDMSVNLEMKTNISVLDYITYLVNQMVPTPSSGLLNDSKFALVVVDDTSGEFGGTYFKVQNANLVDEDNYAYSVDIGYPSKNTVVDFKVSEDDTYAIYYEFSEKLNDSKYVARINDDGTMDEVLGPVIGTSSAHRVTLGTEKTWWTNMTKFPVKATLRIRGLLRPALLMANVRINVYFWGKKHVWSGLYVVTGERDSVNESGFTTDLSLLRVDGTNYMTGYDDSVGLGARK